MKSALLSQQTAQGTMIRPEDMECVSAAFELTLRYLNENPKRFDVIAARDFAARSIMDRAARGEHNTHRLWSAAIRNLEAFQKPAP